MDEEKIDLHPSEADRINENVAELQSNRETWKETRHGTKVKLRTFTKHD